MQKSTNDILCGLSFLAITVVFYIQMEELTGVSRVFPEALLAIIAIGGLWFVIKGFWERRKLSGDSLSGEHVAWGRVAYISAAGIIYAFCVSFIGFFVSTVVFMIISMFTLCDKSRGKLHVLGVSSLFGVVFTVLVWVVFCELLSVPTPTGILF